MAKAEQLITEHLDVWTSAVKAKSSAGQGSNKKIELYGIRKLRQLILELAVRGSLTPSETQWSTAQFGEIFDIQGGSQPPKSQFISEPQEGYVRLLQIRDLGEKPVPTFIPENLARRFCNENDILIGRYGASVGKIFRGQKGSYNVALAKLIWRSDTFTQDFLISWLKSQAFQKRLEGASRSAQAGFNKGDLATIQIQFPPLAEQHRIVGKVDELMALCDQLEQEQESNLETHETLVSTLLNALTSVSADASQLAEAWQSIQSNFDILFTTESSINKLKKTILQLAVMGKLVAQDPEDESAATLLNKVADERDRQAKKQKRLTAIPADAEPHRIPESWKWCQLGELSISSDSGWSPQCDPSTRENEDQWGVLKVSAVSWGEFRANEHKKLPDGIKPRPECEVHNGDFLLSRANTEDLVARGVVVEHAAPRLMMSDKIVRFTLSSYISKSYVNLANGSIFSREHYKQNSSGTSSSMKNVSRETMSKLPIPLPPLAEQNRIVAKFNELMTLCDQLKAKLSQAQETQVKLADSIVEQAIG